MNTHADKTQENKRQSLSNGVTQMQNGGESTFQFIDKRPEAVAQRKLQEMGNNSTQAKQLRAFQGMANNSLIAKQDVRLQAMADNYTIFRAFLNKDEPNHFTNPVTQLTTGSMGNQVIQRVIGDKAKKGDVVVSSSGNRWRIEEQIIKGDRVFFTVSQIEGRPQLWNPRTVGSHDQGWNLEVGGSGLTSKASTTLPMDIAKTTNAPIPQNLRNQGSKDNIEEILKENDWYLDENSPRVVEFVMHETGLPFNELKLTTSGGLSLTIIPSLGNVVYQCFKPNTFKNIYLAYQHTQKDQEKLTQRIAMIQRVEPKLNMAIIDRIIPLNEIFAMFDDNEPNKKPKAALVKYIRANANKLAWDISNAIAELAKVGIVQGDVSIDNIGIKNDQFVLFDFDKAREQSKELIEKDQTDLFTSISKRGNIKPDKLTQTKERIEEHIRNIAEKGEDPKAASFLELKIIKPE